MTNTTTGASNEVLPGAYITFVSGSAASPLLTVRGRAALAMPLSFGPEQTLIELTSQNWKTECETQLGYAGNHEKMRLLGEYFCHGETLYLYRCNGGVSAASPIGSAKYTGIRGNDLTITVTQEEDNFLVVSALGSNVFDRQLVKAGQTPKDNDFVLFDTTFPMSSGFYPMSGGQDGDETQQKHEAFLTALEDVAVNSVGCLSTDESILAKYVQFAKESREERGQKLQCVIARYRADYEGIVCVYNEVGTQKTDLIPWVLGVNAGEAVNASSVNRLYDGTLTFNASMRRSVAQNAVENGYFVLRRCASGICVVADNNSLITLDGEKNENFRSNQVIRVLDQIGNDLAVLFRNKYLGKIPNDNAGRMSLWADIVKHHRSLQAKRAIDAFDDSMIFVAPGKESGSVCVSDSIVPLCAMTKLYLTCYIH